ncbi:hypothetical protein LWI29_018805 [Acer saccharum]|uniref:glutathione transferase n=1 Tax=Acer saccharum TaxID=4024 RepID=A0AA39SVV2_ACESA|nr:hypothetical protein LWI29_018805 [Acer saccharum]
MITQDTFPCLFGWMQSFTDLPMIQENHPPKDKLTTKFQDTWNHNPLLPQDPYHKATARFWVKFGDDKVIPSIWSAFLKQGKEQEDAIDEAIENLKLLEEQLKGKKFFGGDKIGLTDLALGWLANLVPVFEQIVGMKIIDEERFPSLLAWMHEFAQVAIIKESLPPHDKLIVKFQVLRDRHLSK